ncbi:GATA zinc finger domain-containing protein [Sarocladium implicatum]|nr:GATA zinc finger domain-containing protein [Sarocladium implicatum]
MATTTVLQSGNHYSSTPSSAYPTPAAPAHSMIPSEQGKPPAGPPGPPDAKESPSRQSLPSISDVLKVAEPRQFQPPAPPSMQPSSSFPSPFTAGPRGPYPDGDKHASPQTLHQPVFPPRHEPPSAYADSPRSSYPGRPGLPSVSERRPSPPLRSELPPHHMAEPPRAHDTHHPLHNGPYAHGPPAPPHMAGPYAHGPLPPGQVPLPGYPISPHRAGPPGPHPYDPRGPPPPHPEDAEAANRARYEASRHFETWAYPQALARAAQSARTIFNFSEAYHRIASEQSGSSPMPERLPTDHEIADMLSTTDLVKRSLEQVRDLVHQSAQSERIRDVAKQPKGPYDDDDVAMYSEHMKAPQYTMGETKKRRGRAAPPGRCHSCNRIDTPEWRRGPDGARTLCNACGLHYAKLERKRQLEARQIRPKHDDRP